MHLLLPAADAHALLAGLGLVAFGQREQEGLGVGEARGAAHLLEGRGGAAVLNIILERTVEEGRLLGKVRVRVGARAGARVRVGVRVRFRVRVRAQKRVGSCSTRPICFRSQRSSRRRKSTPSRKRPPSKGS